MINFSHISQKKNLGKLLRFFLKLIPGFFVMHIFQGPLQGMKWIKESGVNGYWLGSYELKEQEEFKKNLKSGDIFFDIGAHVGFFSLLGGRIVGSSGLVFSFEPLPKNIIFFKKHIKMNNFKNIILIEAAVGDSDGVATFAEGNNTFTGRIDKLGDMYVKIAKIDTLVFYKICPPPNFIKIDVEGKLLEVLNGAIMTIKKYKPTILFEADYKNDLLCFSKLEEVGYQISPIDTNDFDSSLNFLARAK